jgi:hypothetical protein
MPTFINVLNHSMKGVDWTDQPRAYHTLQRIQYYDSKLSWYFLHNTIISCCNKLSWPSGSTSAKCMLVQTSCLWPFDELGRLFLNLIKQIPLCDSLQKAAADEHTVVEPTK